MLTRQVILDAKGRIQGYEFAPAGGAPADAAFVLNALPHCGGSALPDKRHVFLRCDAQSLSPTTIELLGAQPPVLRVHGPADDTLRGALRSLGLKFALDAADVPAGSVQPDFVWHDGAAGKPGPKSIACNLHTSEQFRAAQAAGYTMFQGDWFARAVTVQGARLQPGQATILQLIQQLRAESDPAQIEEVLKRDPALSFNLLRIVNSSGLGLRCEITSFRHAVMILGLKKLFRWASMLLATSKGGAAPAAGHTAVVRGRLMELLAEEMLSAEERDNAFVVGIFSLLEVMTGVPIARSLEGIALPEPVLDALLRRQGPLAPFLELTLACETADDAAFARLLGQLQLSGHQVNMAHLQALAWAEELMTEAAVA